jgi:polyhydroxyalkanoate synthase
MRNPIQNYYVKYLSFFEKLDDEDFIKNYLDMEHWANDNIPVAGETFREFVKQLYQRNELVRGEFRLDGEQLDLKNITCPLLLLTADRDDLVPATSSLALQHYVGSQDVETMSVDAGHIGLAVGRRSHRHLWPGVAMWIADRCTHAPAS